MNIKPIGGFTSTATGSIAQSLGSQGFDSTTAQENNLKTIEIEKDAALVQLKTIKQDEESEDRAAKIEVIREKYKNGFEVDGKTLGTIIFRDLL